MNSIIYKNGNYIVMIDGMGCSKEIRSLRINEPLCPEFPESIDLKITNKCSVGCPWCHENCTKDGKSFILDDTKKILDSLPNHPIELAIGGGNLFEIEDQESVIELIKWSTKKNLLPRVTVDARDCLENSDRLEKLVKYVEAGVKAIGFSLDYLPKYEDFWKLVYFSPFVNPVVHIIVGIFPAKDIEAISKQSTILILGYKEFGRGKSHGMPDGIEDWKKCIKTLIFNIRKRGHGNKIGFDNLAIEQLELEKSLLASEWDSIYLGNEFSHSMYVDAVEKTVAPTSRSEKKDRSSWDDINNDICEYFTNNKNERY